MRRHLPSRTDRAAGIIDKVIDTVASPSRSSRSRPGSRPTRRARASSRGSRRAAAPLPVRGCLIAGIVGACLLVAAVIIGSLLLDRVTSRMAAEVFPTPTRAPNSAALGAGPVLGPPSITPDRIRAVLESYNSPAADEAQAFYDLGVARGIDPAYCLAFFIMESGAGTRGVARTTYSVGNIRARPGEPSFEGYRQYASWREGIADWYRLIDELYVEEWGLTTVDAIVPIYAPPSDNNDPDAYIRTVKRLVAGWRGL